MSFRTAYHSLNKRTSPKPKLIRDYTDEEWAKIMEREWANITDEYYKEQAKKK